MHWYKIAKKQNCKGWMAVRFNKNDAEKVISWGKKNIPNNILYTEEEGHGRELDTHITIMYGICDDDTDKIREIVKNFGKIEVELGEVGYFKNNDKFDVVIIKIISKDLHNLHSIIKKEIKVKETYPIYKPHCCIAYVKKGEAHQFAGDTFVKGNKLQFDNIVFVDNNNKEITIKT